MWTIVDSNHVQLSQKRMPNLCKLKPIINLDSMKLCLECGEENLEIDLVNPNLERDGEVLTISNHKSDVYGVDEGEQVADWLSRVLELTEKCRLVRLVERLNNNENESSGKRSSFAYKADYLLINQKSIEKIRTHLISELEMTIDNLKAIDEYLYQQFRPNLVVDTLDNDDSSTALFDEEYWKEFRVVGTSLRFVVVENCSRCQMINIDQQTNKPETMNKLSMLSKSLLKNLFKLKSNSKFGIYLSLNSEADGTEMMIGSIGQAKFDNQKLDSLL